MNSRKLIACSSIALFAVALFVGSMAIAEPAKDAKPGAQPEMKLPPGWTQEDMKACADAATPGKMHALLAKQAGTWKGSCAMTMGPGGETNKSDVSITCTPIMDGRYLKCEWSGEMPGMGPYTGTGTYGFDNVSQKFVSTWIDNMSTGIMTGTGELSADGKAITWTYSFNCPITKSQMHMRETETMTSDTSKTIEMIGPDPKTGKEYKMMSVELKKQ
jgi:hypothetical protein